MSGRYRQVASIAFALLVAYGVGVFLSAVDAGQAAALVVTGVVVAVLVPILLLVSRARRGD